MQPSGFGQAGGGGLDGSVRTAPLELEQRDDAVVRAAESGLGDELSNCPQQRFGVTGRRVLEEDRRPDEGQEHPVMVGRGGLDQVGVDRERFAEAVTIDQCTHVDPLGSFAAAVFYGAACEPLGGDRIHQLSRGPSGVHQQVRVGRTVRIDEKHRTANQLDRIRIERPE